MMEVIVVIEEKKWDITGIIKSLTWSGALGQCMRTVNLTYKMTEDMPITYFPSGTILIIKNPGIIFQGPIMKPSKNIRTSGGSLVAHDHSVFMSKSQISFKYRNAHVNEIIQEICKRDGLNLIKNPNLKTRQSDKVFNKSGIATINAVLQYEYEKTKKRYFTRAIGKDISILEEGQIVAKYVLSPSMNVEDIALSEDALSVVNEVIITDKNGVEVDRVVDERMTKKLGGTLTKVLKYTKGWQEKAQAMLQPIKYTYSLKGLTEYADISFISGNKAILESNSGNDYFIIESDSHTFTGDKHTMDLKLRLIEDVN